MRDVITYGCFRCRELIPHRNRGMEITYVAKGDLEWMVEGVAEKVPRGSVFFTLPWQVHGSTEPREPDNLVYHVLFRLKEEYADPTQAFSFPARLGFEEKEERRIARILSDTQKHGRRATPALRWLMPSLISELQGNRPLSSAIAAGYLRAIIVELARVVSGQAVDETAHTPAERRTSAMLNSVAEFCGQAWTLEEMARTAGIRRSRLGVLVRELTGCTPMEYLARLRIERAKTLLRESDAKIIGIAFECGFGSSQYFANVFRRAVGSSPTEYRRRHRDSTGNGTLDESRIGFRSEEEERERVRRFTQ